MKTIAVDFDGVIHRYSSGWKDGTCYDEPIRGAIPGLKKLMEDYTVFILSSRNSFQIQEWLAKHAPEIETQIVGSSIRFWNTRGVLGITDRKLPAQVYIDDRAYLFQSWETVMDDKIAFETYPL